ncbi:SMI1/KNR4 family protein [Nocardiopsis sediminis]|uniref:SMI1/KNR4 family protein n=1 Tax=Nocardiopsis sediminis TaxID=1778267 RepID=A0ABV8FE79_9ACTN
MTLVPPSTVTEWHAFLKRYSLEFLGSEFLHAIEADGRRDPFVSEAQRSAEWLGFEPAGEEEILAAEQRLGVRLPPTYRNFLLTSNGWKMLSYAVDAFPVTDIGWFPDVDPMLFEVWSDPDVIDINDEEDRARVRLLERSLLIASDNGGSGHYLLLADSVAENGEWTAYQWWTGDGGDIEPCGDFAALVVELWEEEHARKDR